MFLLPLLLVLLAATTTSRLTPEQIVKRWADGPVRYLMSWNEEEKLRGLKTPEDFATFINDFWARRDPTPGTFENEYRRMFWGRVQEANHRFRSSTTPGWKTDRGKIYVLLGEPFDIQTNMSDKGAERWTYKRKFSKKSDPEFYAVFSRERGDEWVISTNPASTDPLYDFSGLTLDPGTLPVGPSGETLGDKGLIAGVERESIQANIDLGLEAAAVASNSELVLATVHTRDFVSAFAASMRFEFFRAKDGSTFVNVCGLLNVADLYGGAKTGIAHQRLYASFEPIAPTGATRYATNEKSPSSFDLSKGAEPGGLMGVWSGTAVTPGHYRVTMAVEDSYTGRLGRATAELDVPDFSAARLAISTPVLASSLAEASDRMDVAVRSSGVFRKSEDFGVYYEVYGLEAESGAGATFDVSYLFSRDLPQGPQPIGRPLSFKDRSGASQGWSFPLAKWPVGKYRMEITAIDRSGKTASATVPFEVVE